MPLREGRRAYSMAGSADVRRKKVGESCPILPNRPWALMLVLQSGAGAVRLSSPIYRAQVTVARRLHCRAIGIRKNAI